MATQPVVEDTIETISVFQSALPIGEKLDRARTELLDLSARNRLLNMPRSSKGSRALEIVDERSAEVFRLLVKDSRSFTFLAGKAAAHGDEDGVQSEDEDEISDLAQPEDDGTDERGISLRHSDTRLQTRLTPKGLQKRLLELYFDARTLEEEQGVNILFLTLGAVKWIDPQNAANIRHAPLLLIPVALERGNAGEKFKLRIRADDYASNLSLEAFLDRTQGIRLPSFEATDAFEPTKYFREVADAISAKPGWEVIDDDIVLGFFSFAKFLMYRDLDPANWPAGGRIVDRALVKGLLADGFEGGGEMIAEDANIDPFIPPAAMLHILDSDSSQALAVHEVRRGHDMVIQGPPGTGKSQTIANIIASAVADGKTVLFVAEKMAALEVVKRRLDATGVGDACLELHSSKANKRAVLEELRRTWELGPPRGQLPGTLNARLLAARDSLNNHAYRLHEPHAASGLTPYQVIGQLSRLKMDGVRPNDISLDQPQRWSADEFAERHGVVGELVERIEAIGRPDDHPWRGVGLSSILPNDAERLVARITSLLAELSSYDDDHGRLADAIETRPPPNFAGLDPLIATATRIAGAPPIEGVALGDDVWANGAVDIAELVDVGSRHAALREGLRGSISDDAWGVDVAESSAAFDQLPAAFTADAFERLGRATSLLPRLAAEAAALARSLGRDAPTTLADVDRMVQVGERVASAPDASPEAFAADLWDGGVERAADVAAAAGELERARATIADGATEAAWDLAGPGPGARRPCLARNRLPEDIQRGVAPREPPGPLRPHATGRAPR